MSKIIKIDDKARVEIDGNNYILQYYYKGEKGYMGKQPKFRWHTDGYFPKLVQCVEEHILNAPRASCEAVSDLRGAVKEIKAAESRITKVLTKINE